MNAPAGLEDLQALRHIAVRRRGHAAYQQLLDRIAAHLDEHDGFVAWSGGGKDSTVVVDLARQVDPHIPVIFYDSGLQFPGDTGLPADPSAAVAAELPCHPRRAGSADRSGRWRRLRPRVYRPGVSGPLADIMITGPAAQAHDRYGAGSLWACGPRSPRPAPALPVGFGQPDPPARDGLTPQQARSDLSGVVARSDGTVTYGPIWDWQRSHVFFLPRRAGIEPNPLYRKLAALGCPEQMIRVDSILDPSQLSNGHVAWLQKGWPDLFDQLAAALRGCGNGPDRPRRYHLSAGQANRGRPGNSRKGE